MGDRVAREQALKSQLQFLEKINKRTSVPEGSMKLLKDGAIYYAGRDPQFRPIVVMDASKLLFMKTDVNSAFLVFATF